MRGSDFNNYFPFGWWFFLIGLCALVGTLTMTGVTIWAIIKLVTWVTA
jgi:hypothetical protein